jgi:hypothetical protein
VLAGRPSAEDEDLHYPTSPFALRNLAAIAFGVCLFT